MPRENSVQPGRRWTRVAGVEENSVKEEKKNSVTLGRSLTCGRSARGHPPPPPPPLPLSLPLRPPPTFYRPLLLRRRLRPALLFVRSFVLETRNTNQKKKRKEKKRKRKIEEGTGNKKTKRNENDTHCFTGFLPGFPG